MAIEPVNSQFEPPFEEEYPIWRRKGILIALGMSVLLWWGIWRVIMLVVSRI
jgi:hypothetical protein